MNGDVVSPGLARPPHEQPTQPATDGGGDPDQLVSGDSAMTMDAVTGSAFDEVVLDVDAVAARASGSSDREGKPTCAVERHSSRLFDKNNDTDDDTDPADIDPEVLLKRAKRHMLRFACTVQEGKEYKFRPVWATTTIELGIYGVGVQLYFEFLTGLGILFALLALLGFPQMVVSAMGDLIVTNSALESFFGSASVANLGFCGESSVKCRTPQELEERTVSSGSETLLKDMTMAFGILDGLGMLLFMSFGICFKYFWVARQVRAQDAAHTTPADFSVQVMSLPRKLETDHKLYRTKLKAHFVSILEEICKTNPHLESQGESMVGEVCMVREYNGAIQTHMVQGELLQQKTEVDTKLKVLEKELAVSGLDGAAKEKLEKQVASFEKKRVTMTEQIHVIEETMGQEAGIENDDREVCSAFVVFNHERYKQAVLFKYRFAESFLMRRIQASGLRFEGKAIHVMQACEPSDLFWENLDFHWSQRFARKCVTALMTVVTLLFCVGVLYVLKSISMKAPYQPSVPSSSLWIIEQSVPCMDISGWSLYTDLHCLQGSEIAPDAAFDSQGRLATLRGRGNGDGDGDGDENGYIAGDLMAAQIVDRRSNSLAPRCSGTNVAGNDIGSAVKSWVGVRLLPKERIQCMKFKTVPGVAAAHVGPVRVYACQKDALTLNTSDTSNLDVFQPIQFCRNMQDLTPADGLSGSLKVLSPTSCTAISKAVAVAATKRALKRGTPPKEDFEVVCYCQQQEAAEGMMSFRNLYGSLTEAQTFCEDWIHAENSNIALLILSVLSVLILNQLLLLVFAYFVAWERRDHVTDFNKSQMAKLFLAQFVNTGLLVVMVNANFHGKTDSFPLIGKLVGTGSYTFFENGWFSVVGSSICLTVLLQIASTTAPCFVMSFVVAPTLMKFFSKGLVTQSVMNQVYEFPEWNLALRMAQTMNVVFCILMYSGGMPLLNWIGVVYCLVAYWTDKYCLLRGSKRPPQYTEKMIVQSANMFPIAAFLHTIITLLMFGDQKTFPSDWNETMLKIMEGIVGMTLNKYEDVMERYTSAGPQGRNAELYGEYFSARTLDLAHDSSWLLLLIFLVFCSYYIVQLLVFTFLRPFLQPIWLYLVELTGKREADDVEEKGLKEAQEEMHANGILTSYRLAQNPRYQDASRSLDWNPDIHDAPRVGKKSAGATISSSVHAAESFVHHGLDKFVKRLSHTGDGTADEEAPDAKPEGQPAEKPEGQGDAGESGANACI